MDWDYQEITHLITEYDTASEEVLNSDCSSFNPNLKRFVHLLHSHEYCKYVNEVVLPSVNFDEWYDNSCKTVKSMVGSGNLDWPLDRNEYLSMQLALLEKIAEGKESPSNICSKFMYAGSHFDDHIEKINEQIIEVFIRNYRHLLIVTAENAISESGEVNGIKSSHHTWYQRPIGIVFLGIIVTVIGGLILFKLTSK